MCNDYDEDCGALPIYWIIAIVVAVIAKAIFWSFVCYRWRRRARLYHTQTVIVAQPGTHTVTRSGGSQIAHPVATPHQYNTQPTAPPAYPAEPKNYPSSSPPRYSESDKAPLMG